MKSAREAKDFLAAQIVDEAQRESVPFSAVERKMLYFSETGWTLPDIMDVHDEFEKSCDQGEYETKAAKLIRGAYKRACKEDPAAYQNWWASIRILDKGDHYLSVMVRAAGLRPRHDQLKLFLTALGIVAILLSGLLISAKYNLHLPSRGYRQNEPRGTMRVSLSEYLWLLMACLFVVYQLLRLTIGEKRTDEIFNWTMKKFARLSNKIK
jgi:hypothetical protein